MLAIEIVKEGGPSMRGRGDDYGKYDDVPKGEVMSEMEDDISKQIVTELWESQEKRDHVAFYDAFKAMIQMCMKGDESY